MANTIKRAVIGERRLEVKVISLILKEESRKPKQVKVDLQVTEKGILSGVYSVRVSLREFPRFKLNKKYSALIGIVASADFPEDNPRTIRIATQNYEILEVRNRKEEIVYSNPDYLRR